MIPANFPYSPTKQAVAWVQEKTKMRRAYLKAFQSDKEQKRLTKDWDANRIDTFGEFSVDRPSNELTF